MILTLDQRGSAQRAQNSLDSSFQLSTSDGQQAEVMDREVKIREPQRDALHTILPETGVVDTFLTW